MKKLRLVLLVGALLLGTGSVWAGFQEGISAAQQGDYITAFHEWKPLAEKGNVSAQYNLGLMYYDGQGVTQDYVRAVEWYRKAAKQGDADAQYNLGKMYSHGQGVIQDYD